MGKVVLRSRAGERLAVLGMYCYVLPLPEHRFLLWYTEKLSRIE